MIALVVGSLAFTAIGIAMLRFPEFWLDFLRQASTDTGRKLNRRLITKGAIKFQAVLALSVGGVFMAIVLVSSFG